MSEGPIVIGGTGGSGTRAVRALLEAAGVFMGREVNRAGDAIAFEPLLDESVNAILAITRGLNYNLETLPPSLLHPLRVWFSEALAAYRGDCPEGVVRWGWKNPRSVYLLPLIAAECPGMRFVHVIRDGRDMALSENQNQLRKHYAAFFGEASEALEAPLASLRLWARVNGDAADWAETHLGQHYCRIRIEDLARDPQGEASRLFAFAGFEKTPEVDVEKIIAEPASFGRWRAQAEAVQDRLTTAEIQALRYFGYA